NGVPIDEDVTWDYANRFELRTGDEANKFYIRQGYTTAALNFDREPRFYASLGFDGGVWYGQGRFDDKASNLFYVSSRRGGPASMIQNTQYSVTGYWPKKVVHFQNVIGTNAYTVQRYPWPLVRLASVYLYYAEALNEVHGPTEEALYYVDRVRERAGLAGVAEAWTNFSSDPNKFRSKDGFRDIIQQER